MSRFQNLDQLSQPQAQTVVNPPESEAPKVDPLEKLTEKFTQVQNQSTHASTLAQLALDPDFAALLRAKQTGQKVSVNVGEAAPQAPAAPKALEDMTDQEKLQFMNANMEFLAQQKANQVIAPIQQKMNQYDQMIQHQQQQQVAAQIAAAQAKYADFKELQPIMAQISGTIAPGANCDQLYALACQATNRSPKLAVQVSSERPTSQTARPPLKDSRKTPLPPGRAGMSQLLAESLARQDDSGFAFDEE